ncbi:MAG: prepilin-type N-terminal cleavage/methylation domain-containing protein [Gammaproteobacteria bacterium]|nr:prepilin-type N-terminal cleavage/methylation domain-containing protein [Gammaproteobacteria bacterium]
MIVAMVIAVIIQQQQRKRDSVMSDTKNKQTGIGLMELMLSLAIIAILLVMATVYFKSANTSSQVSDAVSKIQAIQSAGNSWLAAYGSYDGLCGGEGGCSFDPLVDNGYLPESFRSSNNPTALSGSLTLSNTSAQWLTIKITGASPIEALNAFQAQAQTLVCDPDADIQVTEATGTIRIAVSAFCPATS